MSIYTVAEHLMLPRKHFLVSFFVSVISLFSFAQSEPGVTRGIKPPPFLYHWTTFADLNRLALNRAFGAPLPLGRIQGRVTEYYPSLHNVSGSFFWSHPFTGMSSGSGEIYGGEAVIQAAIDVSRARAIRLESSTEILNERERLNTLNSLDLREVDLIEFVYGTVDKPIYREWILLEKSEGSKPVLGFTADPRELRAVILPEFIRFKENRGFSIEELHSLIYVPGNNAFTSLGRDRDNLITLLEKYLSPETYKKIPSFFRRPLSGQSFDTRSLVNDFEKLVTEDRLDLVKRLSEYPFMDEASLKVIEQFALHENSGFKFSAIEILARRGYKNGYFLHQLLFYAMTDPRFFREATKILNRIKLNFQGQIFLTQLIERANIGEIHLLKECSMDYLLEAVLDPSVELVRVLRVAETSHRTPSRVTERINAYLANNGETTDQSISCRDRLVR